MAKAHLKLVTPATVKRTVTPTRPPNAKLRTREYMTETEVERPMAAAKSNRYGHRDATMALVAYRHGLRASELVDLRLGAGRLQNGLPARPASQARQP
jgi:type 1 fimbriae regulatory protein FimB/type 1 fimbriae regulatory protein FimE